MPDEKHPVVIVTRPDTHAGMSCTWWLKGFDVDAEFDSAEVGDRITLEYGEMTQAEFDALGEFDGW